MILKKRITENTNWSERRCADVVTIVLLVRAECVRCPWLLAQTKVATIFGRAECVRCPWLLAQTKVATIFITFFSDYNHTEPEYNHTEPVPYLKTP